MRKSEANMLLEHLEDTYEGSLKLEVWNLEGRGHPFNLPGLEHPYFVVGVRPEGEQGTVPVRQENHEESEQIVVWNTEGKRMSVKSVKARKLTSQLKLEESDVYIYDTRRREFVPAEKFRLPPNPS
ncbi:MAG: hypothetical protein ABEK50_00585 [bacterium]